MRFLKELTKGLCRENPTFRLVLGMCPTLALTTSVENGLGMGMAATFVLVGSNMVISAVRNIIPSKVRIPCYIVIIATFVTIVELMMNGFAHNLYKSLGLFIPLIVVNCIIFARAEAFASKNSIWMSVADGIGMGLGFTLGLTVIAVCREVLGAGTITVWGNLKWQIHDFPPVILAVLAPGGFITLGCLLGLMNSIQSAWAKRHNRTFTPPAHLDCRHCVICKWGE